MDSFIGFSRLFQDDAEIPWNVSGTADSGNNKSPPTGGPRQHWFSCSLEPESEIQVSQGCAACGGSRGLEGGGSSLWGTRCPWAVAASLQPLPPSLRGFSSVRTPVVGLRAALIQDDLILKILHFITSARTPFPNNVIT